MRAAGGSRSERVLFSTLESRFLGSSPRSTGNRKNSSTRKPRGGRPKTARRVAEMMARAAPSVRAVSTVPKRSLRSARFADFHFYPASNVGVEACVSCAEIHRAQKVRDSLGAWPAVRSRRTWPTVRRADSKTPGASSFVSRTVRRRFVRGKCSVARTSPTASDTRPASRSPARPGHVLCEDQQKV